METRMFLMPDYYPSFRCKGGQCRQCCCYGWRVTITMKDYFKLVGAECSPELRRRLDIALHVLTDATEDRYAEIAHDWEGRCPMLRQDGLCMLHAECGEAMLPSTCRYHPRCVHTVFDDECCCSCSCEAVVELMLGRTEPLRMIRRYEAFDLPLVTRAVNNQHALQACRVRDEMLALIQDRSKTIAERLMAAGEFGGEPEASLHAKTSSHAATLFDDSHALRDARAITGKLLGGYAALEDILRVSEANVGDDEEKWCLARQHFSKLVPHQECFFENLLVNHLLYTGYPSLERHETLKEAHLAMCACYIVLLYALVAGMAVSSDEKLLVDRCTACFRIIEHANFNQRAAALLKAEADRITLRALVAL